MRMLVWEPSIYLAELDCRGCNTTIPAKSLFFIEEGEIKYLLPHDSPYSAYSVRCASCGLQNFMQSHFNTMFYNSIRSYDPTSENGGNTTFLSALKQLVRDELRQILKEEAFDPNGPFSPAP